MKPQLNVGDWATIVFFVAAVLLGGFAEAQPKPKTKAGASTSTANPSNSVRTAVAAVELR